MAKQHVFVVDGNETRTLYTDAINLRGLGALTVTRASNVEFDGERGGWVVEFTVRPPATIPTYLCAGPDPLRPEAGARWHESTSLGHAYVFTNREEALAAEVTYLNREMTRPKEGG